MTSSAVEIERKYIIKLPKLSELRSMPEYTESEIEQIYLDAPKGETLRIRRRTWQGRVEYIETRKIRIDKMSATELERSLTPEEYSALSERRLRGTLPIYKTRYTFRYEGQTFELDVYPRWQRTCIMETELPTRDTAVKFPEFIEIIREVTGIKEYSNAGMSRAFPDEDT
ncbi:MAG: CYTH domain-containing protein [Clostridia bacterium]|nr:CYTH domain-containing protein [Clostridia bacterium]